MKSKILLFDIENSPSQAYIWSLYRDVVSEDMLGAPWYIMCWSARWLGEKQIFSSALVDFPEMYKKDRENDKLVLKALWLLLDEADMVIAHNGRRFDVRKTNARFVMNGMPPPSPYKIIDTLEAARKHFYFTSNKLTDLGKYLRVGEKMETGGFKLWRDCMAGNKTAWRKMIKYCRKDVVLLEKIYMKLRPYIATHPIVDKDMYEADFRCPRCGSDKAQSRGYYYTVSSVYHRYRCNNCHGWFRGTVNNRTRSKKETRSI